jgi:hypothetical protein
MNSAKTPIPRLAANPLSEPSVRSVLTAVRETSGDGAVPCPILCGALAISDGAEPEQSGCWGKSAGALVSQDIPKPHRKRQFVRLRGTRYPLRPHYLRSTHFFSALFSVRGGISLAGNRPGKPVTHKGIEGGSIMAFSPTDPVLAHSLWLQRRSSRRQPPRPRWRDWTPLVVSILLLSILALGYVIWLSNGTFESAEQPAQKEADLQEPPVLGVIAGMIRE